MARWPVAACACGMLLAGAIRATPQSLPSSAAHVAVLPRFESPGPLIEEIIFSGLRRIAPAAVQKQISTRKGEKLDSVRIESDVRRLSQLGWFGGIHVEMQDADADSSANELQFRRVRLVFHLEELPYLTKFEFAGSRLLSRAQIEKLLEERKLKPRLGQPAAPENLQRIALTIQSALAELGHPQSRVRVNRDELTNATVQVRFEIRDGPHLAVGGVRFEGHPAVAEKILRREMRQIAPGAVFSSLRGKNAYTRAGFEEDRERILAYYQNHGYPEARIGDAKVSTYEKRARRWFPGPHRITETRLAVSIPVEAGALYRFGSIHVSEELGEAAGRSRTKLTGLAAAEVGQPYSAKAIENLRRAWVASVQPKRARGVSNMYRNVEAKRIIDPEARTVRANVGFSDVPPYLVRRIEFQGLHRFSDRYLRRRILVHEGRPVDNRLLEAGLARVARTGYFRPIRKEDIQIQTDELAYAADVIIRIQEIGKQRASLVGGHAQFGSTLGVVYSVFDLFEREELLSAQLEGGPESLQVALALAKDGFLGSRGSLAFSVFNNVLRPHLVGTVKGPFFTSQSEGLNAAWSYAMTNKDSLAVNYGLSHSNTDYSLALPVGLTGIPSSLTHAESSSRSVGLAWSHDAGSDQFTLANSVSGGWLGGSENVLRSSAQYARLFPDPFFSRQNMWAFRTTLSGAGSYQGDMPLYSRLFSGDELVRGLHPGELGPYAVVSSLNASGNQTYSALPAGANLVTAANAEYRVPLRRGAEMAGFFDLGSGRLLPNWLGAARPSLLESKNGILHGSTGIELRWTIPGVQVPVRGYYAVNLLRLNRYLPLPDGSLFHAHSRFSSFGWALGTLF